MPAAVVLDARERDLIAAATRLRLPHRVESLPLADIELRLGDQRLLLLERKTADDLAKSILDGRWKEQKQRLLHLQRQGACVGYLFEGDFFDPSRNHALPPRTLLSAATMAAVRDRLLALRAKDTAEAVRALAVLAERLPARALEPDLGDPAPVALSKRERMAAPDAVLLRMIRAVPGVSANVARALLQRHPDVRALRRALRRPDLLARTPRALSRKPIGPAVARRLADALGVDAAADAAADAADAAPRKRAKTKHAI
jgi:ERCC4-type nuclease